MKPQKQRKENKPHRSGHDMENTRTRRLLVTKKKQESKEKKYK